MLKYYNFTTFSATKKRRANRRGQDEVFGRIFTVKHGKAKKWEWQGRMPKNSRSTSTNNANWPTLILSVNSLLYRPFTGPLPAVCRRESATLLASKGKHESD